MTTLSKGGQLKLVDDVCKLTLPLTNEREGSSRNSMSPDISTFPVTFCNELNSMVVNFGFPAIMKSDPTVVRSGKVKELNVG
jgi:hypothetical protein